MSDYERDAPVAVPSNVKSFIQDLFRQLYNDETGSLRHTYFMEFSQLTDAYYKEDEWPLFVEIEKYIDESAIFSSRQEVDLARYELIKDFFSFLYTELSYRHIFLHGKPLLEHRLQSFDNYVNLFNFCLENGDRKHNSEDSKYATPLARLPFEWVADMVDEFLYQFEDFCSFRHQLQNLTEDEIEQLEEIDEATDLNGQSLGVFEVNFTLNLMNTLAAQCDFKPTVKKPELLWSLGYVATLAVSRIHVLVADYNLALRCLTPIDFEDKGALFTRLTSVHVTFFYYTGFSYLMLKRYADAIQIFSAILLSHRASERTAIKSVCYADAQFQRKYEKIKVLCTLAALLNFGNPLEENLKVVLMDSKSSGTDGLYAKLLKTEYGEEKKESFSEAFKKNCPRFITPQKPNYQALENRHKCTTDVQAKWFLKEVDLLEKIPDISAFLRMYSAISVGKLANLSQLSPTDLIQTLILIKYRSQQFLREAESQVESGLAEYVHTEGVFDSVADVHFYLENETVNVDEKQKKQKFADFYLQNANKLGNAYLELKSNGGLRFKHKSPQRQKSKK